MAAIRTMEHVEIYKNEAYNSFPSVVQLTDGTFALGFRTAPDRRTAYGSITHLDASSKAVAIHSADGCSWDSRPAVIWDDYFHGVQDPCLNVLRDGTLFVTFFTWKVYEQEDAPANLRPGTWHRQYDRWIGRLAGSYSIRSTDGGVTWDRPEPIGLGDVVIRGNCVERSDGSILAPLYIQEGDTSNVVIGRTTDRGQIWERYATVSGFAGEYHFHEPNLYETESGKLVLFIRSQKKQPGEGHLASPLFTAESTDGGRTWTEPQAWPIYSPSPFHVLRLTNGNVLLNYGYRYKPYGIRAIVLNAECTNIGTAAETVIRDDGLGSDIGYTSAVQLSDGRVLIAYYFYNESDGNRYIAGSLCQVE
ncbi:sialidase family protein [Paenibacillus mendelii]|uniref:Sialidase family protein n=1 Tax=Paenibacillus mendelii TaxID=206163 RepID=A0ABV6JM76_9BACL|nr:sialidase family protein [Paenibacillus mendelii]MCQ6562359.1 glycoside hydrolase [Paenibacillus mendelii]